MAFFGPEIFLTGGSVIAGVAAVASAVAKVFFTRATSKAATITIQRADGSKVQLDAKGATPEDVERLVAALSSANSASAGHLHK